MYSTQLCYTQETQILYCFKYQLYIPSYNSNPLPQALNYYWNTTSRTPIAIAEALVISITEEFPVSSSMELDLLPPYTRNYQQLLLYTRNNQQ